MVKVVREKKKCQGFFLGLVISKENKSDGLYSAIKSGECEIIEYVEHSNIPELLEFGEEVAKAFIKADELL